MYVYLASYVQLKIRLCYWTPLVGEWPRPTLSSMQVESLKGPKPAHCVDGLGTLLMTDFCTKNCLFMRFTRLCVVHRPFWNVGEMYGLGMAKKQSPTPQAHTHCDTHTHNTSNSVQTGL